MNYRHSYHAGNFADVFKHTILVALINSLKQKDTSFCYLDTHSGTGIYDLKDTTSQKSKEFENGIEKILLADNPPELIINYIDCVRAAHAANHDTCRYYPGSPTIAAHLLRPQDRAVLIELHPDDYKLLKNNFHYDKRIGVHLQDAYQALKAFLPPKERRGLVLIDPPYERPDELADLSATLAQAVQRWDTGIYALWYPIKAPQAVERFYKAIKQNISRPMLVAELGLYPENTGTQLNGCGILIVNPPWKLEAELKPVIAWLWKTLSPNKQGRYDIKMI